MNSQTIEHEGIVKEISNGIVRVEIISTSACAACHAQGTCPVFERESKIIDIADTLGRYELGETVNVVMEKTTGFKALFLGYLAPFLILLITLIVGSRLSDKEYMAGITAIAGLAVYYLVLYLFRKKLNRTFTFCLRKIS